MENATVGEVVLRLAILFVCYPVGLFLSVLLHEIGHSLVALFVTKQYVVLSMGRGEFKKRCRLGRLVLGTSFRSLQFGSTSYDRKCEGRITQLLVALGGPVVSLALALLLGVYLKNITLGAFYGVALLALFIANFRILIVSVWPITYRPNNDDSEVLVSDGLDIWRLLRGK